MNEIKQPIRPGKPNSNEVKYEVREINGKQYKEYGYRSGDMGISTDEEGHITGVDSYY